MVWLVVCLPLWKIWQSLGIIVPNRWKKNQMFQTTNQQYMKKWHPSNLRLRLDRIFTYRVSCLLSINDDQWTSIDKPDFSTCTDIPSKWALNATYILWMAWLICASWNGSLRRQPHIWCRANRGWHHHLPEKLHPKSFSRDGDVW